MSAPFVCVCKSRKHVIHYTADRLYTLCGWRCNDWATSDQDATCRDCRAKAREEAR
jgi:hypothetical protein